MSAQRVTEKLRQKSEDDGHCVGGQCDISDRNTEGQNTERQKDRKTETQDRMDRKTEKTEQTGRVGAEVIYPNTTSQDEVKAFIKRFRAWADYNPDDERVPKAIAWLKSNGYQVEGKSAGKYRVTKYKATNNGDGAIIHEWDVLSSDAE